MRLGVLFIAFFLGSGGGCNSSSPPKRSNLTGTVSDQSSVIV